MRCGKSPAESFLRISPFVIFGRRGQKAVHWAPKHLLAYCGMPELHLPERRICFPSSALRVRMRDWNAGGGRSSSLATSKCKLKNSLSFSLFFCMSHTRRRFTVKNETGDEACFAEEGGRGLIKTFLLNSFNRPQLCSPKKRPLKVRKQELMKSLRLYFVLTNELPWP